jgi:hypothetical protein
MARDRAALADALRDGPAARVADARDYQRHFLCHAGRLSVAAVTERLAAVGGRFTAGLPPGATTGALNG